MTGDNSCLYGCEVVFMSCCGDWCCKHNPCSCDTRIEVVKTGEFSDDLISMLKTVRDQALTSTTTKEIFQNESTG